jgi:predicted DNA-binding transcriptional regulator YafY
VARPTARVLALLEVLQSGGIHTVAELAERLGVDERTVRRYVDHLTELDVPVESVRGRYGGYRLAPGYRMPPLMLTDDEALAMLLGLVAGRHAGLVTSSVTAADTAAAKLRRVLPRALGRRLNALLETTEFTAAAGAAGTPQTHVLLTLAEAAWDRHPVAISYTTRDGRRSERTLQPYGLVAHSGRWYVTGADSISGEVRTFRLDRIAAPHVLPGTFGLPDGFDTAAHVLTGLAQTPYQHDVSLRIQGTLERIRSGLPEGIATVEELRTAPASHLTQPDGVDTPASADGWFRVRLRAERLEWIPTTLAALGCPFVIERPDELRGLVRDLAQRLASYATWLEPCP